MNRVTLVCKLKGHIWQLSGQTPDPNATGGTYIVHNVCFRCGLTRKEQRHAVAFVPRSD